VAAGPVVVQGGDYFGRTVNLTARIAAHAGPGQVLDLLGPGYSVVDHPDPSSERVGAALASRWPVRCARRLDLHITPRADLPWAAVVVAEVLAPTPLGPLLAIHHKPNLQYDRETSASRRSPPPGSSSRLSVSSAVASGSSFPWCC
jgi:hypothetical protein